MSNFYLCSTELFELKKSTAKVYSFLHMVKNAKTNASYYKRRNIAHLCGISESSVVRAIRELCEKGLLIVKRCFKSNGRQTSNLYVLVDSPQTKIASETPSERSNVVDKHTVAKSKRSSSAKPQGQIRLFPCISMSLQKKLSPAELLVHHYLVFRSGKELSCRLSKKEIAANCGVSLSTVSRAIRKLCFCGLLEIHKLTRREKYGNNGTSVNHYILKWPTSSPYSLRDRSWKFTLLFIGLLSRLTPSLLSWVTPQRTMSRTKVTLKQRKEEFNSKLAVSIKVHIVPKRATLHQTPAKHHSSLNTG